jgi:hypothetical protein
MTIQFLCNTPEINLLLACIAKYLAKFGVIVLPLCVIVLKEF